MWPGAPVSFLYRDLIQYFLCGTANSAGICVARLVDQHVKVPTEATPPLTGTAELAGLRSAYGLSVAVVASRRTAINTIMARACAAGSRSKTMTSSRSAATLSATRRPDHYLCRTARPNAASTRTAFVRTVIVTSTYLVRLSIQCVRDVHGNPTL